jgi:hypothetical protein
MKKSVSLSVPFFCGVTTQPPNVDVPLQIWLFNPSLHLTYGVWNRPTGQKPIVVHAAKVFFKLVDPIENVDLSR